MEVVYMCRPEFEKGGGLREWPPMKMGKLSERCLSEK